jgi:hypothetical protein
MPVFSVVVQVPTNRFSTRSGAGTAQAGGSAATVTITTTRKVRGKSSELDIDRTFSRTVAVVYAERRSAAINSYRDPSSIRNRELRCNGQFTRVPTGLWFG